jgi:hypothetical protein
MSAKLFTLFQYPAPNFVSILAHYYARLELNREFAISDLFVCLPCYINSNSLILFEISTWGNRHVYIALPIKSLFAFGTIKSVFNEEVVILRREQHLKRRLLSAIGRLLNQIIKLILVVLVFDLHIHPLLIILAFPF